MLLIRLVLLIGFVPPIEAVTSEERSGHAWALVSRECLVSHGLSYADSAACCRLSQTGSALVRIHQNAGHAKTPRTASRLAQIMQTTGQPLVSHLSLIPLPMLCPLAARSPSFMMMSLDVVPLMLHV